MLILVNKVEKNGVDSNEHKSIKKSRNIIVKILTKSKSWNLSKSKKVQSAGAVENLFF